MAGSIKKRKTKTILGMGIRPGMLTTEARKSSLNNIIDGAVTPSGAPIAESRQTSPEIQILDSKTKGEYKDRFAMLGIMLTLHVTAEEPRAPYQVINYVSPVSADVLCVKEIPIDMFQYGSRSKHLR